MHLDPMAEPLGPKLIYWTPTVAQLITEPELPTDALQPQTESMETTEPLGHHKHLQSEPLDPKLNCWHPKLGSQKPKLGPLQSKIKTCGC